MSLNDVALALSTLWKFNTKCQPRMRKNPKDIQGNLVSNPRCRGTHKTILSSSIYESRVRVPLR